MVDISYLQMLKSLMMSEVHYTNRTYYDIVLVNSDKSLPRLLQDYTYLSTCNLGTS